MWQEARKQEKKLRGLMIDYKKRAERRQAYYAKMVSVSTQFYCFNCLYMYKYCVKAFLF